MKIDKATMVVEWSHPTQGRMSELLCDTHRKEVLAAIRKLGIGCMAEKTRGRDCERCIAASEGILPRDYIRRH